MLFRSVGVHAAADTEYSWPFYGQLVGAWFSSHPAIQQVNSRTENRAHPATAYVDALTSHPARFGRQLEALLGMAGIRVVAENRADAKYPVVQAAAILAKVTRDAEIARLARRWGPLGSGYPSDPVTRAWLAGALRRGPLPPFVRRSWATLARV